MRLYSVIDDDRIASKILVHLGLPSRAPPRGNMRAVRFSYRHTEAADAMNATRPAMLANLAATNSVIRPLPASPRTSPITSGRRERPPPDAYVVRRMRTIDRVGPAEEAGSARPPHRLRDVTPPDAQHAF
jgi:hypothetical protein